MKKEVKKLMNKSFLLSVGLASLTIEKADKIVKELVKLAKDNLKKAKEFTWNKIAKNLYKTSH